MSLDTAWQVEQTWGSNQPVLTGVVSGLRPRTAIECGCGNFSTPILVAGAPYVMSIEHDRRWAREMQKTLPATAGHEYEVFPLDGITNGTPAPEIQPKLLEAIVAYYSWTFTREYDFALIDTFRCARVAAARVLMRRTQILMLHDVEPKSRDFYDYHALDADLAGWHRYEHRPMGFINSVHQIPWTALYSREPLDLDAMQPHVIADSERLWGLSVGLEEIRG